MSEGDKYIGLTVGEIEAQRANDRQVGGKHYRTGGDQHWDIVDRYSVPYLEGVGSKYPLRWREKGGVEDLEKTLHYIDKIMERPDSDPRWQRFPARVDLPDAARRLAASHGCGQVETVVVETLLCGFNRITLTAIRRELERYIVEVREQPGPGTPEDGGHHARQPDETVAEVPRHFHLYLPDSSAGEVTVVGDIATVKWGHRA